MAGSLPVMPAGSMTRRRIDVGYDVPSIASMTRPSVL